MSKIEEVVDRYLNEMSIKKFDDVLVKSKNKMGMVYDIKGKEVTVKTPSGLIKTTMDDLKKVMG